MTRELDSIEGLKITVALGMLKMKRLDYVEANIFQKWTDPAQKIEGQ